MVISNEKDETMMTFPLILLRSEAMKLQRTTKNINKTSHQGKFVPKNQQLIRVSILHPPKDAPNGTFSQPESMAGARRDCDARNCFNARICSADSR